MNGISKSRRFGPYGLVGGGAVALATAMLAASCGGGGGGGGGDVKAAAIDAAAVTTAAADVAAFMPLCNPAAASERVKPLAAREFNPITKLQQLRLAALTTPYKQRALALTGTKPADVLGNCGGRYGYGSDYSHTSGVTTGTLIFTDYCTTDTVSGERTTVNGRIGFVNTATPTSSGPITTKLEANSADGVTAVVRDATGKVLSSETVSFTGFSMTMGNPGGEPSATSPDRLAASELKITNNTTSKTYRQTNWSASTFTTASGGEQTTLSGRGYRSNGDYYDVATTVPFVFDAAGNTVSGTLSFSGANGNSAVVTLVPGATLQASVTVNGTPLAGLPACKK